MLTPAIDKILFPHPHRLGLAAAGLLMLISFFLYLPGIFSLPPIDRDEARFAEASRQMVESGNWVDIRFQDEVRYKKPVGIYWLQAGTVKLAQKLGVTTAPDIIGLYRLPSLLGALLSVVFTGVIGARLLGAREGLIGAALFSSCLLINVEAHMAKTDAMLLACILACVMIYTKAYTRAHLDHPLRLKDFILFWVALAFGFLIKGPVILLVVIGLPLLLRLMGDKTKWLSKLKPVIGIPLAIIIVAPWFIAILTQSHGTFLKESAGQDLLTKFWQPGQSGAFTPPGVHTLVSLAVLWPVSLPLWLALPWIWKNRKERVVRFLLAWTIPIWVVFELIFTKLPHYVLPAYPALTLLATAWLLQPEHAGRPPRGYRAAFILVWSLVAILLCLVPAVMPVFVESQIFFFPIFFGGLALGLGLAAVQLLRRDQRRFATIPLYFAGAILSFALFRFLFPDMPSVFVSARIAEKLAAPGTCMHTTLVMTGYTEPSLVFLAGKDTRLVDRGEDAALALSADPCITAGVAEEQMGNFKETLERVGARATELAVIKGFNYARGKPVKITLYQAKQ
jgi:4-amino-4-deoxy-L-arabinose transferase-like glycosyltransferase